MKILSSNVDPKILFNSLANSQPFKGAGMLGKDILVKGLFESEYFDEENNKKLRKITVLTDSGSYHSTAASFVTCAQLLADTFEDAIKGAGVTVRFTEVPTKKGYTIYKVNVI